ncbi:hypothetical protein BGZ73_005905 [Actinomortierella ambigua]|nr:hypothetical protein BGZ73_005905 [Actinomortierella ambigua]
MRFSKALILLVSATVAFGYDAVISRGILIGKDLTNLQANATEIYQNPRNHQTAAASILVQVGKNVQYDPHTQNPSKAAENFARFEKQWPGLIGFRFLDQAGIQLHVNSSLDDLQRKIEQAYNPSTLVSVGRALRQLVPKTTTIQTARVWTLSLVTIDQIGPEQDKTTRATLISMSLNLNISVHGEVTLPAEQIAVLNYFEIKVYQDDMDSKAPELARRFGVTTTSEFQAYFTSTSDNTLTLPNTL